ncbi:MAG: methionine adenosyltransferase [Coriobacteriales bacterium]|nr:methionine adenosyltransferase [Coriobacteriales bacterium]
MRDYIFTSESVTAGHPDKICDQISDAVLDAVISEEVKAGGAADYIRSAVECLVTRGQVFLAGELRCHAYVDIDSVVRAVIKQIGYTDAELGFQYSSVGINNALQEQSADIAQGVDREGEIGAGDQGIMFGYACNETAELMPLAPALAHALAYRLAEVRTDATLPYLRPDGKTQVSVQYLEGKPAYVDTILISAQHADDPEAERSLADDLKAKVIAPVFERFGLGFGEAKLFVNPTGRFVIGGPAGDTGLTGRKIIVDTYGGVAHHGGGAFSGKDPTKVDRSAAYMARYAAKNVVAAGLAEQCELQLAYGIGIAHPLSIMVNTFGSAQAGLSDERIAEILPQVFDFTPSGIITTLDLWRPIYHLSAAYGHFGRELAEFTWERIDKVSQLQAAL